MASTYRRTFSGYIPAPRTTPDGPWLNVRIYEGLAPDELSQIDDQVLAPVDPNPADPLTRTVTTDLATLPVGWYQLVFYTGSEEDPSDVEYYGGALSPSVQQVADYLRARTVSGGVQINRFDDTTDPTDDQVAGYVAQAGTELVSEVGREIPVGARDLFRAVVKIGTAMLIEVNSEDINEARYDRLATVYDRQLAQLREAVQEVTLGGDPGEADDVIKPISLANPMRQGVTSVDGLWLEVD